jgi:hypothetical protein
MLAPSCPGRGAGWGGGSGSFGGGRAWVWIRNAERVHAGGVGCV